MSDRPNAGPRLTHGPYLIQRAMQIAIAAALDEAAPRWPASGRLTVIDVGGRGKPYAPLLASRPGLRGRDLRHLAIDAGPGADIVGAAEALPAADGCADLVLCTQVLEHVAGAPRAVSEMARILKPGGLCLLTTHGTWFYHPDPEDYWRWTSAGLRRIFEAAGFAEVEVRPVGGAKLALTVLALTALERAAGEGFSGRLLRRALVAPVNLAAAPLTLGRVAGRRSVPGELAINYLVSAARL